METQRERSRDTGRGRSRLHAPGAWCGIRSRVSRITTWAKGRFQTTAPPRDPLFLTSQGPCTVFSTMAAPVRMPTRSVRGSLFSIASTTPVVSSVVNFSHSVGCQVTSYCDFHLNFPFDVWRGVSFGVWWPSGCLVTDKVHLCLLPICSWIICV